MTTLRERLSDLLEAWAPIPTPDCPTGDPFCGTCEDQRAPEDALGLARLTLAACEYGQEIAKDEHYLRLRLAFKAAVSEIQRALEGVDSDNNVRCNLCSQIFSSKGYKIHFGMKHASRI
jgi:hypothetical protein